MLVYQLLGFCSIFPGVACKVRRHLDYESRSSTIVSGPAEPVGQLARTIFLRISLLFIVYTTTTPQNNKIHAAHVGGEINAMNINKILPNQCYFASTGPEFPLFS